MPNTSIRQNKTSSRFPLISAFLILLLFTTPLSAFAQDTNSIDTLRQMGKAFAEIAGKASPAVVGLKAEKTVTQDYPTIREWPFGDPFDPFEDDFFDFFFRRRPPRRRSPRPKYHQMAQGSGFIVSPDGYILTNNHLVEDAEKVFVKVGKDPEVEAKVVGTDPDSDVAVIKIDAKDLHYLELADSDALEVGEWVIAIGNPFGLSHTVTAGIVSAKGRSGVGLTTYEDFIQTDAAINPGNSGGPLLNLDGKVVGINTAIVTRSPDYRYRGNIGIGFAIPANMAKAVYNQLIESGTVVRGFLGISMEELTPDLATAFGLKKDTKGVAITEVIEGSAAEKAGLKHNDIIIEFEGQPVAQANVLRNRVAMLKPGTKVEIVVLRDGKRKKFTAELGERTEEYKIATGKSETMEQLGLTVQNLTDDWAERLGYENMTGVVVTQVEPGSLAALAGITPGTLIREVNRTPVKNTKDFSEAVEMAGKQGAVLLRIYNGRYHRLVVLTLPQK